MVHFSPARGSTAPCANRERASFLNEAVPFRFLQDDGKWLHVKETTEIGEGKM